MAGTRAVPLRNRVLVNLKTGRAVRGVLVRNRGGALILKSAELLEPKANPVPVDGDVVVLADNVDFVQVIPATGG